MSIAQRSVAGEGEIRPLSDTVSDNQSDIYSSDTSTLPWKIHHAQHRALYSAAIPTRARLLLAELARTIDLKNPLSNIFMRRDKMSARSHIHIRTLSRALNDLETAGLIVRHEQRRYDYGEYVGCFSGVLLNLTEKAADLLGLIPNEKPSADSSTHPVAVDTTGAPSQQDPRPSFTQPTDKVSHGLYKDLSPGLFQKRQPGQLPEDLERLRSLGFHEFFIFRLMREAREQGKFLSDVVEVAWKHLKRANAPINYLRSLLRSPTDFSHQVRTKRQADIRVKQVQQEEVAVRTAMTGCAGQVFFDSEDRRIVISDDAQHMTIHDCHEASPRAAGGIWQGSFVKAMHRGSIRAATDLAEEAFAARLSILKGEIDRPVSVQGDRPTTSQTAALEAQKRLKELLRGARMSRPLYRTAGAQ